MPSNGFGFTKGVVYCEDADKDVHDQRRVVALRQQFSQVLQFSVKMSAFGLR